MNGFRPLMGPPGYKELQVERQALALLVSESSTTHLPAVVDSAPGGDNGTVAVNTNGAHGSYAAMGVGVVNGHHGGNGFHPGEGAGNGGDVNGHNGIHDHPSANGNGPAGSGLNGNGADRANGYPHANGAAGSEGQTEPAVANDAPPPAKRGRRTKQARSTESVL
jgi:hypothetical protein